MDLEKKYLLDLENARKHKLWQDKLRFGIAAAYFTYVGGLVAIMSDSNNSLTSAPCLVSAFIGFCVFLILIAEHYWYVHFRIEEEKLENLLLLARECISQDDLEIFLKENSSPNLYQVTIFIILLWTALSVSAFALYPVQLNFWIKLLPILFFTYVQLLIFRHWHTIHKKLLSKKNSWIGKFYKTK